MASSAITASQKKTAIRLYRILLNECRVINRKSFDDSNSATYAADDRKRGGLLLLQSPLDPTHCGRARILESSTWPRGYHEKDKTSSILTDTENDLTNGIMKFLELSLEKEKSTGSRRLPSNDEMDNKSKKDESLLVSSSDLATAIRSSFRKPLVSAEKSEVISRQRLAIDALRILDYQIHMLERTSISLDEFRGVRIIATSSCVGRASPGFGGKNLSYKFAYRIRVENLKHTTDPRSNDARTAVQLLGRSWTIVEEGDDNAGMEERAVVNQPRGGAVGKQPVILPGEVFEYMSFCELFTPKGNMSGHFSMATVGIDTKSAMVGEPIEVLQPGNEDQLFDVTIHPFQLLVDNDG